MQRQCFNVGFVVETNLGTRVQLDGVKGDVSRLRAESGRVT